MNAPNILCNAFAEILRRNFAPTKPPIEPAMARVIIVGQFGSKFFAYTNRLIIESGSITATAVAWA